MKRTLIIFTLLFCTGMFDLHGQTVWESNFELPASTFAIDIQETSDGNYLLYGGNLETAPDSSAFLLKFTGEGDKLWTRFYDLEPGYGTQTCALTQCADGDVLLCGNEILRVNEFGEELWTLAQPARDLIELPDGSIMAIHYDSLIKISTQGEITNSTSVGVDRQTSLDLANDLFSSPFSDPIPSSETFTSIELLEDDQVVITGTRIDDDPDDILFPYWYGPVTKVIDSNSLDSVHTYYQKLNVLFSYFPFIIDNPEVFNATVGSVPGYVSIMKTNPQTLVSIQGNSIDDSWQEQYSESFFYLDEQDVSYSMQLEYGSYKYRGDSLFCIANLIDWTNSAPFPSYLDPYLISFDAGMGLHDSLILKVGSEEHSDFITAFVIDNEGFLFAAGIKDVPQLQGTIYHSDDPDRFFIARFGTPTCIADLTGNGVVDIEDFLNLNSEFGETCDACPADINGDGIVDIEDFLELNSAFGSPCPE